MGSLKVDITDNDFLGIKGTNITFTYEITSIIFDFRISKFELVHLVGLPSIPGDVTGFGTSAPGLVTVTDDGFVLTALFDPELEAGGAPYPSFHMTTLGADISNDLSSIVGNDSEIIGVTGEGASVGPGFVMIGTPILPVAEPATLLLLGSSILFLVGLRRWRFFNNNHS